jgi:carboxypeptidase Taq
MSHAASKRYEQVCRYARQTAVLASIEAVLDWDEHTMLPPAGTEHRAQQMTLLSGMVHDRWTNAEFGQWLAELVEDPLAADPDGDVGTNLRRLKREYDKKVKLPKSLVEELAQTAVFAQQAWVEARRQSNFNHFRPWLGKMLTLKRQEAEALGYAACPYDALLDRYEPDARTADVAAVLAGLRQQLVPLVQAIRQGGRQPDVAILHRSFPPDVQQAFGRMAASRIGFDFDRGRLDVTAHPFCSGLGPSDCRITTRYDEHFFNEAFFGILHEAGHGIYEQGLLAAQYGLPLGEAVSLGIHESQSRLWENFVGRSLAFWQFFYPDAQRRFASLSDVPLGQFHFAVNDVRPSLIRTEADEATYNLHILVRFELEQSLLNDELPLDDLPGAWNAKYEEYLGITPPDAAQGVLQDIHWSAGLIGYFPTYALGNLNAAQFFRQADAELGGLDRHFAQGDFQPLRQWLGEKIHRHGQRYSAAELIRRVTGQSLSHVPLVEHLRRKFGPLYYE